jgi:hypothetical protein
MRLLVLDGVNIADSLFAAAEDLGGGLLVREFARRELIDALLPGMLLDVVVQHGDQTLWLWLIDTALAKCGSLPHRGGHHVTRGAA